MESATALVSCDGHAASIPATLDVVCKSDGLYVEYNTNGASMNLGSGVIMTLLTMFLSLIGGFFWWHTDWPTVSFNRRGALYTILEVSISVPSIRSYDRLHIQVLRIFYVVYLRNPMGKNWFTPTIWSFSGFYFIQFWFEICSRLRYYLQTRKPCEFSCTLTVAGKRHKCI